MHKSFKITMVALGIMLGSFFTSCTYAMRAVLLSMSSSESTGRIYASDKECKFITAAADGKTEKVRKYIHSKSVDIDAQDIMGRTALYRAAHKGNGKIVSLLLDEGADPDVTTNGGTTPLMAAASSGCKRAIAELILTGANVTISDKRHKTAHTYAAYHSDETADFLKKAIETRKQLALENKLS